MSRNYGRGWLSPFEIREVRVVGADVVHPSVVVAEAGLNGERLHLWSDFDPYAAAVLRDPMLVAARFERRFPNRLTLVVEERRPIALLQLDRLTPVDAAGLVLPVSAFYGGWDVPVVTVDWERAEVVGSGRVRVGAVRHALTWLAAVETRLPALYGGISTVELDARGGIALRVDSPDCVVLLDERTSIEKLSLLDDVLRDLEAKGESYSQIDLRFDDQIVVRRG